MDGKTANLTPPKILKEMSGTLAKTPARLDNALRARSAAEETGGALEEILETLYSMRELIEMASTEALGQDKLDKMALALDALSRKIDALGMKTGFEIKDFTGCAGESIEFNLAGVSAAYLGVSDRDIGDTVRGGSRRAISNQPLGVAPSPGKYDVEKLKSLGITLTATPPAPHPDVSIQTIALRQRQKN